MKTKLILFAIFGIVFSNPLFSNPKSLNTYNPEEKVYWDFLKERLFDGENSTVSYIPNDFFIHLEGASSQDSIIVKSLMMELRKIITNRKVRLSKDLFVADENNNLISTISVGFNFDETITANVYVHHSKKIDENQIFFIGFNGNGISQHKIRRRDIDIKFNDSISFADRKRYIEYAIIKSMCTIKGNPMLSLIHI